MTLRARLMVALLVLVTAGLAITGVVTYTSLRSFLTERVDEQLEAAVAPVARSLAAAGSPFRTPRAGAPAQALPPGTYGEFRDRTGATITSVVFVYRDDEVTSRPDLAEPLPSDPFTTDARDGGSLRYRALATPVGGGTVIVAIPLTEVSSTLDRLLAILAAVSAAVLVGLGLLARLVIERGLRPLREIERTAGAIAGGDLSRRIPDVDERTEVGRLGVSLNAMLARIEHAFAEKETSEERLRRFLADASHELRTPLTSIRGYAELFRRGADARHEDLAKAMRRIEDEAARMGMLVEDMLLLARLDQGRPLERAPVDLTQVAADVVADARALAPDRPIELDARDAVEVIGDAARLRQIATNLVRNALVHTPAGTPVRVRALALRDHAVLEVADEGPGIEPGELELIFDRFHRGEATRAAGVEGAGIGLAIALAIARAHGGDIWVESFPGRGTTFRVLIPLARATERAPAH